MYYAVLETPEGWIELERGWDKEYLEGKYPEADIIGGW